MHCVTTPNERFTSSSSVGFDEETFSKEELGILLLNDFLQTRDCILRGRRRFHQTLYIIFTDPYFQVLYVAKIATRIYLGHKI